MPAKRKKTKAKKAKDKKAKKAKRKAKLESPSEIVQDFVAGMVADKEIADDIQVLGDPRFKQKIRGVISTGACTLDCAIGRGGAPLSRLTILHGKEGSGKTTVALEMVAEVQRKGGLAVYIDKEYKLDPDYAEKIGVDLARMIIVQPKTLEGVIKQIHATIRRASEIRKKTKKAIPILIVVDSLNACKAWDSVKEETGKKRYPAEARIWSEELPFIVEGLSQEHVGLVLVSQVRKKMNVKFGSDEEMAGGMSPRFYASLIIYIKRIGAQKDSTGEKTGSVIEAECKKNQISPPFKTAKFIIFYARGVDYEHSLILQCEKFGWVKKKGGKGGDFKIGKVVLGKSRVSGAETLRARPKVRDKMIALVRKKMDWDEAA